MKRFFALSALALSALALTSCKVNCFGNTLDVPWYFIAVPVILIFAVSYIILMSRTYVCPECKNEFKPKWYRLSVGIHFNGKRIVTCPKCGRRGFCERKK